MRLSGDDLRAVAAILREAGRTEVMPRFRNLAIGDTRSKTGPLDLVTVADERAEAAITQALTRRFPGCAVIGEEAASADPGLLARLGEAELTFVVDPIDGTSNFCAGLPLFGVMAAVLSRGVVVGAVIHDPVSDDTALAVRGEGAWLERPDGRQTPLRVAAPAPLAEMTGAVSWRYMPEPMRGRVCARLPRVAGALDLRCAAHTYRLAAAGHCHFTVFYRLLPWDHAAGWLLHREAGGWSARLDGSEYDPADIAGGLVCAPDRASWAVLREALFGDGG